MPHRLMPTRGPIEQLVVRLAKEVGCSYAGRSGNGFRVIAFTPMQLADFARACMKEQAKRDSDICHERFMELEHGTNRTDESDDYEAGLKSAIAKELRDAILKEAE